MVAPLSLHVNLSRTKCPSLLPSCTGLCLPFPVDDARPPTSLPLSWRRGRLRQMETSRLTRPGSGRLLADPTRPKRGSGAPDVQTDFFSLLNRWEPARGFLWHNYNKPECLLAYSSTLGVRQQTTTTMGVRQPISPNNIICCRASGVTLYFVKV